MTDPQGTHPDATTLDRYRIGELDLAERERVAAHLESCASCAHSLADLEALAGAVGRAYAARRAIDAHVEPDWPRLRSRIADRTAAERREILEAARPARRSAWVRWAPQTAAAVLALVVVGVLWRQGVREPGDARRVVEPSTPETATDRSVLQDEEIAVTPKDEAAGAQRPSAAAERSAQERREAEGMAGDDRFRQAPAEARKAEPGAAAPAAKAPPPDVERVDAANEAIEDRMNAGERARYEAREEDLAAVAADRAAPGPLVRFELQGRAALAHSDTVAAARALELWHDSVAVRTDLLPDDRRAARALADSLAELVETGIIQPD